MLRRSSLVAVACLLLAGCGSTAPAQQPTQAAVVSAQPSPSTVASPSAAPTVEPSPSVAASPSPVPTPTPDPLPAPLVATTYKRSTAGRHPQSATTENWAGYTVTNHGRAFDRVDAEWTVVAPTCSGDKGSAGVGVLIGMNGGFGHPGTYAYLDTAVDCDDPSAPAYAEWQTANDDGDFNMDVNVGDHVRASVEVGAEVSFTLVDETTNEFDTATANKAGVKSTQAEWVVLDDGCKSGSCPPLPKFAPITISQAVARSNGHIGSIDDPAWVPELEAMSEHNHAIIRARPSSLSASGSRFTVRWLRK